MNKISIIVPAYNIENYISKCLDSILAQTYKDLEIIVVDDGSTDRTGAIIDEYDKKDDRIIVIHQQNRGLSGARNSALKVATGDYIAYVDGDDHIEPEMYETMLKACLDNDASIAITAYREIDEEGRTCSDRQFSGKIIPLSRDEALDIYISDNRDFSIKNCVWSKLFKRDIVKDLVFPEGHNSEDILYTTRALCSSDKCVFTDIPLYDYLQGRSESIMNVKISKRRLEDEIPFLKEQLQYYKENVSTDLYDKAVYAYAKRMLFYYFDLKERGMGKAAKEVASIINEDRELIDRVYEKDFISSGDKKRMDLFKKSPAAYHLTEKIYADTVVPLRQVPKGVNKYVALIGNISFYLGVLCEIIIMFIAKSDYTNPCEGLMFRIPFVLFCIKILCSKHSIKEILLMVLIGGTAVISYFVNTRDELVRIAVFLFAMKDIDQKHVLGFVYKLSVFAMGLLAFLSVTGIFGRVTDAFEGYGFKEGTTRLALGVGNSNSLAIMIWALMVLAIYLYHERFNWKHYAFMTLLSVAVYPATLARTALAMMLLTIVCAIVLQNFKNLRYNKVLYVLGALAILGLVAFSVWSACVSDWHEFLSPGVAKLNDMLTGRIEVLSRFEDGGGRIANWKLFSAPEFDDYFDMGYVRLFFWYGIIPGSLGILMVLMSIRESYRRRDYMGFLMIMMFGIFTVIEAHVVSVYIARNYVFFLTGAYMTTMFLPKTEIKT